MSHQPERIEKNCLNCGTTVAGRYCQVCGQENTVSKQTVWGLITHFIYDIFHFDGKFFETIKRLFLKPGFIPRDYIRGRRVRYLDPIRMYLFISAIFFLVFIAVADPVGDDKEGNAVMIPQDRLEYASTLYDSGNPVDSLSQRQLLYLMDTTYRIIINPNIVPVKNDSTFIIRFRGKSYMMMADILDPVEVSGVGDNWFDKMLETRFSAYRKQFGGDSKAMVKDLINRFMHNLPYIFFISLPFFALILKLLYVRRKEFYYADHAVFTLYHYNFTFFLMFFVLFMTLFGEWTGWGVFEVLTNIAIFWILVYLLISMKRFYQQGWGRTVIKFLLLFIFATIMILVLMTISILLAIFQE